MRAPFENLPIASTPAVLLNGAGIYDYEHEKMLRFHAINPAGYELVCAVMKKFPTVEVEILTSNSAYAVNARIFANVMLWADDLPHRKFKKISEVPPRRLGKGDILRNAAADCRREKIFAFDCRPERQFHVLFGFFFRDARKRHT